MTIRRRLISVLCAAMMLLSSGCASTGNAPDNPSVPDSDVTNAGGETTTASTTEETTESSSETVTELTTETTTEATTVTTTEMTTEATTVTTTRATTVTEEKIQESLDSGIIIEQVSNKVYKPIYNGNPISANVFCADPTAVEYEGRLYVYGTNDQEMAEKADKCDYGLIKSLVVFSTDDMANWVYHGRIEVGEIAPWIFNSWAPSIVSRVEDDGLTHFYLYFSNSGAGVGVLTSTDPVTGWTDPLGKPLIYQGMPNLENCPAPFDPGVCIDDNGVGWLSFGGGTPGNDGVVHSFVPKIVKLGEDMLSFDSEFVSIDAPYFCEASELNYIDGTYYYTYCNDWQARDGWDYEDYPKPPICSMAYLTTKTPLDADSWEYRGAYLYNAGDSGMRPCNNHTHFLEYKGVDYIIHHTMLLEENMNINSGFRSIMVDYLPINTETEEISLIPATKNGVSQIKLLDPYAVNHGNTAFTSADIGINHTTNPPAISLDKGAWVYIKGADFGYGADSFTATVKGKGRIEVRLDDIDSKAIAYIEFDNNDFKTVTTDKLSSFDGRNHNVYFVFSDEDIELKSWQFTKGEDTLRAEEPITNTEVHYQPVKFLGQVENPYGALAVSCDLTKDGNYSLKTADFDPAGEVLNLGFIDPNEDSTFDVLVRSITLATDRGDIEIPVDAKLNPRESSGNGLANGWGGKQIGDLIYGDENVGIFAAETDIEWIGYRMALMIDGEEVKYSSITYNITVTGLTFEE